MNQEFTNTVLLIAALISTPITGDTGNFIEKRFYESADVHEKIYSKWIKSNDKRITLTRP